MSKPVSINTVLKENIFFFIPYKLFLFISGEPCHLLFVGLHLLFVVLKVSHYEPRNAEFRAEISSYIQFALFICQHQLNIRNAHLFSLALCLKSSTAFMNRVTLNSPLSWSSNSRLEYKIVNKYDMQRCSYCALTY